MPIDPEVQHFMDSPAGCVGKMLWRGILVAGFLLAASIGGLVVWFLMK